MGSDISRSYVRRAPAYPEDLFEPLLLAELRRAGVTILSEAEATAYEASEGRKWLWPQVSRPRKRWYAKVAERVFG